MAATVRSSSGPLASAPSRMSRPTPAVSATARTIRRRRSARPSACGAGNEALGHPPQGGAGDEAERPAEDHRPDQGRVVGADGVAGPEDEGRAEHGGSGEGERPIGLRHRAEAVEGDDGRQERGGEEPEHEPAGEPVGIGGDRDRLRALGLEEDMLHGQVAAPRIGEDADVGGVPLVHGRGAAPAEAARAEAILERALDDTGAARTLEREAVVDGRGDVAARALGELALEHEVDGRAPRRGDAQREPAPRRRHLGSVEERRAREEACVEGPVAGDEPEEGEAGAQRALARRARLGHERALADVEEEHEGRGHRAGERARGSQRPGGGEHDQEPDDGERQRGYAPAARRIGGRHGRERNPRALLGCCRCAAARRGSHRAAASTRAAFYPSAGRGASRTGTAQLASASASSAPSCRSTMRPSSLPIRPSASKRRSTAFTLRRLPAERSASASCVMRSESTWPRASCTPKPRAASINDEATRARRSWARKRASRTTSVIQRSVTKEITSPTSRARSPASASRKSSALTRPARRLVYAAASKTRGCPASTSALWPKISPDGSRLSSTRRPFGERIERRTTPASTT